MEVFSDHFSCFDVYVRNLEVSFTNYVVHLIIDGLTYNTRGYFASCVVKYAR